MAVKQKKLIAKPKYLYALRTVTDFVSVLEVSGSKEVMRLSGQGAMQRSILYEWEQIENIREFLKEKNIAFRAMPVKVYNELTKRFINVD